MGFDLARQSLFKLLRELLLKIGTARRLRTTEGPVLQLSDRLGL